MPSLKKNIAYSSILTVSGYLFPLFTFPYVTRVLGVNNIGICNFVDSIVYYFMVFSTMGVGTVGVREIARTKHNPDELSRTYSSLLSLNLLFTFISILVLFFSVQFVPKLQQYHQLFYVGAAKILANSLLIEWLFRGLENFKFITLRSILVRSLYVICVFIFVRNQDDYVLYFILTTLMYVVNAVINVLYGSHYVEFSLKHISFKSFIRPFLVIGLYIILTNAYTTFNVTYLGFVRDTVEVGYYYTATKLYSIIMSLFTAFTGVMIPRMSSLLVEGKESEFKRLTKQSVEVLFAFALPLILISEICAPQIIRIVAGDSYAGSILPMRIVTPLMIVIGYEQIVILQMLTPMKKDSAILINSIIGAVIGLSANILIVGKFGAVGTSIVWVVSELSVLTSAQFFINKYIGFKLPFKAFIVRCVWYLPAAIIALLLNKAIDNVFLSLGLVTIVSCLHCAFVELVVMKNEILLNYWNLFKSRIHNTTI